MSTKLTKGLTLGLIGFDGKKIRSINSTICWRKPAGVQDTKRTMARYKYAIGMVSAHNIYRKANTSSCKIWCHCFRDVDLYLPNRPTILMSESDFVDPVGIKTLKPAKKWDFYYFTMGGLQGNTYKGMELFVDCLPVLCGKLGLRGVLIKYAKPKRQFKLNRRRHRLWGKYKKYITVLKGKQNVAQITSKSKFGFFPNIQDCSPLLLTESLVRGCPILVNEDILGGWKYVNDETGAFFTKINIEEKARFILDAKFKTRKNYMKEYGYKNSAIRLADFCKEHIPILKRYSMIGFAGTNTIMEKLCS